MKKSYARQLTRRSFLTKLGATVAGVSLVPKGWSAEDKKLNFYNWDTYIGEDTLSDFKDDSGITVKMDFFGDNDELFAKLRGGNPGYDVIVPTNDFVKRMRTVNMLQPLDLSMIPNFKNLDSRFQNSSFDPDPKHSIPYMWGTMGIGYRKSAVDEIPSLTDVFDSEKYSGRIAWLSESGSMFGFARKYLGESYSNEDLGLLKETTELLIKQKKHVKVIAEDNGQDLLASGEVDLAVEWNGDIQQVMLEDSDLDYVLPEPGALVWMDNLCIPVGAPHPENAHKFIDFILRADVGAEIADYIQYATPNEAARKLMDSSYRNNTAIFPPPEALARCDWVEYLSEDFQEQQEEAWTKVLAA